ncbi:MAG: endo-1,4-beta-xylanase, partial [Cohnella sp.]|nr:endo-1,4-beta-xylanase [Cohnella sp.]
MPRKLHEAFAHDFLIGAAVNATTISSQRSLLLEHFNSITAENEMKFERLHPEEDRYTFEAADRLAGFAREHGMRMRGHTLVWHNQTPAWVFQDAGGTTVSKERLLSRMKEHIDTVVSRYRNDIYCWDVVNEAIADEGPEPLRQSPWLEIAGPGFIDKAFEFAHEADPTAQLFYNDYNECFPEKRERIYSLVRGLLDRGVPIHGVGLQGHWNLYGPTLDTIRASIERYAELGLKLQLTE